MGKTSNMNWLDEGKSSVLNDGEGYDRESVEFGFDRGVECINDKLDTKIARYRAEAREIEHSIIAGRIPDWKMSEMMEKVKRLRQKANTLELFTMELEQYTYDIKSPQGALEGSIHGGIHK